MLEGFDWGVWLLIVLIGVVIGYIAVRVTRRDKDGRRYEDIPDHEKYHNVNPPPTTPRPKISPPGQGPRREVK